MSNTSDRKAWAREHLRGIENCTFPSFDPTLSTLDEKGIRLDIRQAIAHGFVSTLCTCEAGLTMEEAKRFLEVAVDEAGTDLGVSTTLIRDSFDENLELAKHMERIGGHGALIGYPFNWYPQDENDVYEQTRALCEAADLNYVLYATFKFNFGRFHPSGWPLDVLERMAVDFPNTVACKLGILEPGFIYEAFHRLADKVVIQFPWERWWPLLRSNYGANFQFAGAGAYEAFQSTEKPMCTDYFQLLLEDRMDEAMAIYWRLTPVRNVFEKQFMPTQMIGTYHWPQQKYYQWLVGGNGGFTRQPVMKMMQYEMDEMRGAMRAVGIAPSEDDSEFFVGRSNAARGAQPVGAHSAG